MTDLDAKFRFSISSGSVAGAEDLMNAEFLAAVEDRFTQVAHRYVTIGMTLDEFDENCPITPQRRVCYETSTKVLLIEPDVATCLSFDGTMLLVRVAADDMGVAKARADEIITAFPHKEMPEDTVQLTTWYATATGYSQTLKRIKTSDWSGVERNYPSTSRQPLADLMTRPRPEGEIPRIILLYGAPGTGKTHAIRALSREWKKWCSTHVVADPERFFNDPGYLLEVGSGPTDSWRLVVAEDTDAFLHAGQGGSAAMGRLLNFSDGILGQGTNTLFLLTTNEPIGKLHPAITRPGRCLAQIEFSTFSPSEASEWLGEGYARPDSAKTLAELIEYQATAKKITHEVGRKIGFQHLVSA